MAFEPLGLASQGSDPREVGQQSLRAVIETNFDGMVVIDRDGAVRFVNPAAERLLGRPSTKIVGAQFGFPYAPGGAIEIELVAGEELRMAEMRVVKVQWEGVPAFLASLRDVTERKRAEEESLRLAAIVEQSRDAIFAFDRKGVITAWNRGAERMLGHAATDAQARASFVCDHLPPASWLSVATEKLAPADKHQPAPTDLRAPAPLALSARAHQPPRRFTRRLVNRGRWVSTERVRPGRGRSMRRTGHGFLLRYPSQPNASLVREGSPIREDQPRRFRVNPRLVDQAASELRLLNAN
jgi:PAS domain-containing protein